MSDVIEAMEEAIDITGDVVTALKVAEEQGWRLVPVEPTKRMLPAGGEDKREYLRSAIQAAPRPWEHSDD